LDFAKVAASTVFAVTPFPMERTIAELVACTAVITFDTARETATLDERIADTALPTDRVNDEVSTTFATASA
jgi:hypothetical protein